MVDVRAKARLIVVIALVLVVFAGLPAAIAQGLCPRGVIVRGPFDTWLYCFPDDHDLIVVNFGGEEATFSIFTDTSVFRDDLVVATTGPFAGYQITGVASLEREIVFDAQAAMSSMTEFSEVLASFQFSGTGTVFQQFNSTEGFDEEFAYIWIDLEYAGAMWVQVIDGVPTLIEPVPPRRSALRVSSVMEPAGAGGAADGTRVAFVTLVNAGNTAIAGPLEVTIGLSYAQDWVPEMVTRYWTGVLGQGALQPGESITVEVEIPPVPMSAIEWFEKHRTLYPDYVDPDPGQDYIGIVLELGEQRAYAAVPFDTATQTFSMRKGGK